MRLFRLGLGIAIAIQAFRMNDLVAGFIAAIFLFQALSNTGCCRSSGCHIAPQNKQS
jgi:hypothetical protein